MNKPKCHCGLDYIVTEKGYTLCPSEDRVQPQEGGANPKDRKMSAWDIAHNQAHRANVKEWYK